MSYARFRASIHSLEYVDDIYVEIRNLGSGDIIVGFFDINDTAETSTQISQIKVEAWKTFDLRIGVMSRLASICPSYFVFCDVGMKEFHLHSLPFSVNNYQCFDELSYIKFLQGLEGAAMSHRPAQGPKYPALLPPYSVWHYRLGWACKCRDVDYFEIRNGEIRAILEITGKLQDESHLQNSLKKIFQRWSLHQSMFRSLMTTVGAPAYFVVHTIRLDVFYVFNIDFEKVFSGSQFSYKSWLKQL